MHAELKSFPFFNNIEINKYSHSFVPYLYLDGHRSSSNGESDFENYQKGFRFFLRFASIMQQLGFSKMVTMAHTKRNSVNIERVKSIHSVIQKGLDSSGDYIRNTNFLLYGDIESYKTTGEENFYNYLNKTGNKNLDKPDFTHHILINYSEQWALNNIDRIDCIPEINCVIRFTKGFISGGWIPNKMQKTVFVYSQIPSVSEFWSDKAILALILIALKTWISTKDFIGTKSYNKNEKELIHKKRDLDLSFSKISLQTDSPLRNRIISFEINGPVIYEL